MQPHHLSLFEALMLICFGVSWPVSIIKLLQIRQASGKSRLFLIIIILGYCFGIIHKLLYVLDWVIILYALNLIMVCVDLALVCRFQQKRD